MWNIYSYMYRMYVTRFKVRKWTRLLRPPSRSWAFLEKYFFRTVDAAALKNFQRKSFKRNVFMRNYSASDKKDQVVKNNLGISAFHSYLQIDTARLNFCFLEKLRLLRQAQLDYRFIYSKVIQTTLNVSSQFTFNLDFKILLFNEASTVPKQK